MNQLPVRKHSVGDLVWWIPRERATDNRIKCGKIESIEVRLNGGAIPEYIVFDTSFVEEELYSDPRLAWKELLGRSGKEK